MKRIALNGLLIAVALVLSVAERWVPLTALVPIPGIKLGLANIVTLFALYFLRPADAWAILIARCLLTALVTGGMTSLLFSLAGGALALLTMQAAFRFARRFLSITGISVAGASAHNIGQILAALLVLRSSAIVAYLPVLLASSCVTGVLIALLATSFFRRFARTGLVRVARTVLAPLLILPVALFGTGCGTAAPKYEAHAYEFIGSFDTVIQLIAYTDAEEAFNAHAVAAEARFAELNRLFDIYNDYDGLANIRTINENAGIAPVKVSGEILDLVGNCLAWYGDSPKRTNIALGPVLALWHDARDASLADPANARIPELAALQASNALTDPSKVKVDRTAGTIFLEEEGMSLDVGAVAKGYACQLVADELKARGLDSFLISGGGNVVAVGSPKDGRASWGVGIQNPAYVDAANAVDAGTAAGTTAETASGASAGASAGSGSSGLSAASVASGSPAESAASAAEPDELLDVWYTSNMAVVTSGDYQRTFTADGRSWHHLIDPDTLMPAEGIRSVTIGCADSGRADFLSTTVFLMPYAEGRAYVESLDGVEALWCFPDGSVQATDGMKAQLKKLGGAANPKSGTTD